MQRHELNDPVIQYTSRMIASAIAMQASDIHLEPNPQEYRIRIRAQGLLSVFANIPTLTAERIIAHFKAISHLDVAERRLPQDGHYYDVTHNINFRISTIATRHGEKLVLRLLQAFENIIALDALGFHAHQLTLVKDHLKKPQGLILVSGPTGSGKTMTLYAALAYLNQPTINIVTIENPVEIDLPNINQTNIDTRIELTFTHALRSILRQDPDIIMIGEIRDQLTANIAIEAAQTGHLILASIHASNTLAIFKRLQLLGIPLDDITTTVSLVIAQRLVTNNNKRTALFEILPMSAWLHEALTNQLSMQQIMMIFKQKQHITIEQMVNQHRFPPGNALTETR